MGKIGDIQEEEFWNKLKATFQIDQEISYQKACEVYNIEYSKVIRFIQLGILKRRKINGICYVNRTEIEKLLHDNKLIHIAVK